MRVIAVLAAAGLLVAGCTSSTRGSGHRGGPKVSVTCQSITGAAVSGDKDAISRRVRSLGGSLDSLTAHGSSVIATIQGVAKPDLAQLCVPGELEFRGLVAPAAAHTCMTTCSTNVLSDLPEEENGYEQLSPQAKSRLAKALAGYDCSGTRESATTPALVACSTDRTTVYLFGPAIVTGDQIVKASAQAPGNGVLQWTVQLTLNSRATAAWSQYTSAHHTGSSVAAGSPTECGQSTPCSDYVDFVLDGVAVSVPLTQAPITGSRTQVSGGFDQTSAQQLARALGLARLPVPLKLVSVR